MRTEERSTQCVTAMINLSIVENGQKTWDGGRNACERYDAMGQDALALSSNASKR